MLKHLDELDYKVSWKVLNSKDYGVAQSRERIVIVGNKRKKFNFDKLIHNDKPTCILDVVDQKEKKEWKFLKQSEYVLIDPIHVKKQASGMIFVGHRDKPMRKSGVRPNTEHLSRVHRQCNRIYSAEGTHPTIASQEVSGRHHIYIDNKVRKLTIGECYRLMGFHINFKRVSSTSNQYRQIGNSVSVKMIEAVIKEVKEQLLH